MKYTAVAIYLLIASTTCSFAQKTVKKATYIHEFPVGMQEDIKQSYIKLFEKGRVLYQINCASCHNTKVNGVETMPEFTKEHLAQYELRIQNPKHEEPLSEMRVTAEELAQIMIFLTYYKKAGTTTKAKK